MIHDKNLMHAGKIDLNVTEGKSFSVLMVTHKRSLIANLYGNQMQRFVIVKNRLFKKWYSNYSDIVFSLCAVYIAFVLYPISYNMLFFKTSLSKCYFQFDW